MNKYRDLPLENVVNTALALSKAVNNSYYDLGEVLFYLKETEAYKAIDSGVYAEDKAGWRRFCDDKLDVGYRTAQYWVNIYAYFYGMRIEKEELDGLGWSKAKELVDLTENHSALVKAIKFAKEHTLEELKGYVSQFKKSSPPEAQIYEYETIRFKMPSYQAEQITDAIGLARDLYNLDDDSVALSTIALDWLQAKSSELSDDLDEEAIPS